MYSHADNYFRPFAYTERDFHKDMHGDCNTDF